MTLAEGDLAFSLMVFATGVRHAVPGGDRRRLLAVGQDQRTVICNGHRVFEVSRLTGTSSILEFESCPKGNKRSLATRAAPRPGP